MTSRGLGRNKPDVLRRCLSVALALSFAGCTFVAPNLSPSEGGASWRELRGGPFILKTNLDDEDARAYLTDLLRIDDALRDVAFRSPEPNVDPVDVIVFSDRRQLTGVGRAMRTTSLYALMDEDERPTVVLTGALTRDGRVLIQRMLSYHHLKRFAANGPLWLRMGVAAFLESMRIGDGEVIIGEPPERLFSDGNGIRAPVEAIVAAEDYRRFEDEHWDNLERSSWALTHVLSTRPEYADKFRAYMSLLIAGAAHDEAWPKSFTSDDEKSLSVLAGKLMVVSRQPLLKVKLTPTEIPALGAARILSESEVRLLWARITIYGRYPDKAEDLLREHLEAARAAAVPPHETTVRAEAEHLEALFLSRRQQPREAEPLASRASSAVPGEMRYVLAHLSNCLAVEQTKPAHEADWSRCEAPASRLMRQARGAKALNTVARYLTMRRRPERGIPFARRSLAADPACWTCMDTLASLLHQHGDLDQAVAWQERAVSVASERRVRNQLIEHLEFYKGELEKRKGSTDVSNPSR